VEIPHISITARCLPEAYERAIIAVWNSGVKIKTQYDKETDPESKDAHVTVCIREPFSSPMYHLNIPGGPEELETYIQEVLDGIHDNWINKKSESKWKYTYHQRLRKYSTDDTFFIDQIDTMCKQLAKCPYTRRAQAITWQPDYDITIDDPPCLQRIWGRVIYDDIKCVNEFQMHTYWRSRDLYKAWFFNVIAMIHLQDYIANKITEYMGKPVYVGAYHDTSDSLHIYGSYFEKELPKIEKMYDGNWESRSVTSEKEELWNEIRKETREKLWKERMERE
jgi:thymidylate synthase